MIDGDLIGNDKQQLIQQAKSNHLLELQKEIKEEEDEIFADLNSLINGASYLYSSLVDDEDEEEDYSSLNRSKSTINHHQHAKEPIDRNQHNSTFKLHHNFNNNSSDSNISQNLRQYLSSNHNNNNNTSSSLSRDSARLFDSNYSDDDDQTDYHSADDLNLHEHYHHRRTHQSSKILQSTSSDQDHHHLQDDDNLRSNTDINHHYDYGKKYPSSDVNIRQYDENLYPIENQQIETTHEDEQINENLFIPLVDQQNYEKIQAYIQQVTSNLPKPCVFFLEGNCRRSDCKYSHDLSNITCKYWIEGFCFKGELCPFLHSYNPNDLQDSGLSDESGVKSLSKQQLNPTFVIESEADFPSLPLDAPATASNDCSKSSIDSDTITTTMKNQILSSNPSVVFKTVKKKRKRG